MTEEELAERRRAYAEHYHRFRPRQIETMFADGIIGIANAGGVARLTFVREVYNTEPEAAGTSLEPVFVLAMPHQQLLAIAHEIIESHKHMLIEQEAKDATKQ